MFGLTLLFISTFTYFGLIYGYEPYLTRRVQDLEAQIRAFSAQIPVESQTNIIRFYSQLANLNSLLRSHLKASPAFAFIENAAHPNVYFTKFDMNADNRGISLSGVARSVRDITEQVRAFQERPEVEQATFNNVNVGQSGLWQFDVTLVVRDVLLHPSPAAGPASAPAGAQ
ncbi:MAG: hypothetical protein A2681_01315 [Candidatus Liptonbacteria bacterium RIFCSPHIGHO2_01_FULL_56_18b]|nr:MAG: hypothetical protein A2681_01315 [Candidatus Liptonbacteria bacterium RIFCSPHIGHO2_01_FULL_56_18b]